MLDSRLVSGAPSTRKRFERCASHACRSTISPSLGDDRLIDDDVPPVGSAGRSSFQRVLLPGSRGRSGRRAALHEEEGSLTNNAISRPSSRTRECHPIQAPRSAASSRLRRSTRIGARSAVVRERRRDRVCRRARHGVARLRHTALPPATRGEAARLRRPGRRDACGRPASLPTMRMRFPSGKNEAQWKPAIEPLGSALGSPGPVGTRRRATSGLRTTDEGPVTRPARVREPCRLPSRTGVVPSNRRRQTEHSVTASQRELAEEHARPVSGDPGDARAIEPRIGPFASSSAGPRPQASTVQIPLARRIRPSTVDVLKD